MHNTLDVAMGKIPTFVRMFLKNSVSNRLHYLYSAAVSETLGEASPTIDAQKTPSALRSPGSIQSSAALKASTLNSMGISHHLENMRVRPRSIDKILENNAADMADSKDDGTTRNLEPDFEHEDGSNQSQEAYENLGTMDWDGEGWTQEDWDKWVAMGCPDDYGITVPVGLTAAALEPQPVPHRLSSVLMQPCSDISVGMRDPGDPCKWADLFYQGKNVKEVS